MPRYLRRQSGRVMIRLGKGLPCPLISASWVSRCDSLIVDATVFGTPILLKRKADKIPVEAAPLPSQPSHPHQPSPPPPCFPVSSSRSGDRQSDLWGALDGGPGGGYTVSGPVGCPGGLGCGGCRDAQAAGGNEGDFGLGDGGGGRYHTSI